MFIFTLFFVFFHSIFSLHLLSPPFVPSDGWRWICGGGEGKDRDGGAGGGGGVVVEVVGVVVEIVRVVGEVVVIAAAAGGVN